MSIKTTVYKCDKKKCRATNEHPRDFGWHVSTHEHFCRKHAHLAGMDEIRWTAVGQLEETLGCLGYDHEKIDEIVNGLIEDAPNLDGYEE